MSRLSIVLPLQASDAPAFEDSLASILRNRPERSQIVVAHDGSYVDLHDLKSLGVHVVQVPGAGSYGELFFATLSHCTSPLVHWLRPGTMVDEGWCESPIEQFANTQVASVTPLLVSEKHPDRILTAGITCGHGFRLKLVGTGNRFGSELNLEPCGPSAWAAFYRHACLRLVASQLIQLAAANVDLELALIFRSLGWLNVVDVNCVVALEHPDNLILDYRSIRGIDTQRILYRYHPGSLLGSLKSTVSAGLAELLSMPVSPRRGLHGLQRLAAVGQMRDRRQQRQSLVGLRQAALRIAATVPPQRPTRTAA